MKKEIILFIVFCLLLSASYAQIEEEEIIFAEDTVLFVTKGNCSKIDSIVDFALAKRGLKYQYGCAGPTAFDCSGFTTYIFSNFGIPMGRSSRDQYLQGKKIERKELQKGDLVFFIRGKKGNKRIGHVGIVIETDSNQQYKFIHASNSRYGVRVDNSVQDWYANTYAGARRIVECNDGGAAVMLPNDTLSEKIDGALSTTVENNLACSPAKDEPVVTYHKVKQGDTLYGISKKYHVSINDIKKWNHLKSDLIRTDQRLKIYR